jgi:hypothetical protein
VAVCLFIAGACANLFDGEGSEGPTRAPRQAASARPSSGGSGAGAVGGVAGAEGGAAGSTPVSSHCAAGASTLGTDDPIDMVVLSGGGCLTRAGKVWCWGSWSGKSTASSAEGGLPWQMAGLDRIVDLAAGAEHICALDVDGHVFCWGRNESGQAGRIAGGDVCPAGEGETEPCEPKPKRVTAIEGAVGLALGERTSCARLEDSSVKCWGLATEGSTWLEARSVPEVFTLGRFKACVAETDGTVSCSGAPEDVPPGLANITQLSMSIAVWTDVTCALSAQGTVTCWGNNDLGGLGVGNDEPAPEQLGQPAILSGAVGISARGSHACALLCSGRVSCWGRNFARELGRPSPNCELLNYFRTMPCAAEPGPLPGLVNARLVEVGPSGTCVALADGAVWCWGSASPDFSQPTLIPGFWQDVPGEEVAKMREAFVAIADAVRDTRETSCRTAADCRTASTSLSCFPTCQGPTLHEDSAAQLEETLYQLGSEICAGFEATDNAPAPECPELALSADCSPPLGATVDREGACVSFDPVAAGCTDACECESLAEGSTYARRNDCAGSNLIMAVKTECSDCPRSYYVRVANIGAAAFEGEVVFEHEDSTTLATLSVMLEPNELSEPIRLPANGGGRVSLVAADDCDDESEFRLQRPPTWCQP